MEKFGSGINIPDLQNCYELFIHWFLRFVGGTVLRPTGLRGQGLLDRTHPTKNDQVSTSFLQLDWRDWARLRLRIKGWTMAQGECETERMFDDHLPGFWIPIHLIGIRIQHFRLNTWIRIQNGSWSSADPGFLWPKIRKILQLIFIKLQFSSNCHMQCCGTKFATVYRHAKIVRKTLIPTF